MRLLIFKVNQLGDNIVFLPVVQWLERVLPDCEITVATSAVAAPVYRSCTPRVKAAEFATAEFNRAWGNPFSMLRLHQTIRALKPGSCLLANDQGNVAHLLAWSSGARLRVGPAHDRLPLTRLLTRRVALDTTELIAVQNWRLLRAMLESLDVDCTDMPQHPPIPDMSAMKAMSAAEKPFVLIHPGASVEFKRWPAENFVCLANKLNNSTDVRYLMQGHAAESTLHDRVTRVNPGTLESFTALMSQAALFIGNNSGPMHLASAFGIPSVIFSGSSPHTWLPAWNADRITMLSDPTLACQPCEKFSGPVYRCANTAEPMACLKRWSVDSVHELVLQKLGAR